MWNHSSDKTKHFKNVLHSLNVGLSVKSRLTTSFYPYVPPSIFLSKKSFFFALAQSSHKAGNLFFPFPFAKFFTVNPCTPFFSPLQSTSALSLAQSNRYSAAFSQLAKFYIRIRLSTSSLTGIKFFTSIFIRFPPPRRFI